MGSRLAVNVPDSLLHDVTEQLGGGAQGHAALLDAGGGQQVFHQIHQPHGVVINVRIELSFGGLVKHGPITEQTAGVAGNGGQRGTQVVGNGPQQVRPKLLTLGQNSRRLLLPGIPFVLQSQCALAQNGHQDAVFRCVQRGSCGLNTQHPIDPLIDPHSQVQVSGSGKLSVVVPAA